MGKMSYLCRCGKPIVVGSSRFGANPVVFATAFQQAVLRLPHPFDRFFHISPQNGISIVTADDLRFFPHFRSNFPQSFPHIVENSCVKIRDHVVPPRKNMLWGRHFSVTTCDIPAVLFCRLHKNIILSTFLRFFYNIFSKIRFSNKVCPFFHTTFQQGVGKPCGKPYQMSRFSANLAFCSMNTRRGSTLSPMSRENMASQAMASSMVTFKSVRVAGSMVVSHS